ncbi:alpha/beta hydrolase [Thermoactinomyces sp. DSM 45892]|uniref:alpha/beta hydrolase n=1 Tax=Thermoactinomyces sp. DSM 45892 TaxID=1882753 RepID=UPI000899DCD0|nr:alpha/beta hydrolase [Thermoactinomyces sp. DSM 45892]SDY01819.1 acetyl esterase [Thermoactinomyces sp. DSM 45892]
MIESDVLHLLNQIYTHMDQLSHPPLSDLSPTQSRYYFQEGRPFFGGWEQVDVNQVDDRVIRLDKPALPVRIYRPAQLPKDQPLPALIYLHGGGWVLGDLDSCDSICSFIANRTQSVVVSVDYRLAPEHKFPIPLVDTTDAVHWIHDNAYRLGIHPDQIMIGGESAGANLAAAAAIWFRNSCSSIIKGQLLITPVTHCSFDRPSYLQKGTMNLSRERMMWFWDHYLQSAEQGENYYASPLLVPDASNLPPAIVVTAGFDPLHDEGREYGELLQGYGVMTKHLHYPRMVHSFIHMAGQVSVAHKAFCEMVDVYQEICEDIYNLHWTRVATR